MGFWREWGGMCWWVMWHPGSVRGESGGSVVWRMSGGEWGLVMGGGWCVGTAACEQVRLLVMMRRLQWSEAVAVVALALGMVLCGGVPWRWGWVGGVVGRWRLHVHGWFHLDRRL